MIIAVPKMAAIWLFHKGGDQQPHSGGNDDIQQRRQGERQETAFMRYAKHKHRQAAEQEKVQHPQRDVWQLFTKQKFTTRGGGVT